MKPTENALTNTWNPHIMNHVMNAPEVFASFLFLPTFLKTEPGTGKNMSCPRAFGMPGDGRRFSPGTGLLNIAGEKIGAAALWVIHFR